MILPIARSLLIGIWLGFGSWALAQESAPPSPPPSSSEATAHSKKRFDLSINNNTAQEVVDLLSHQLGYPLNVIFVGDAASRPMPSLRLHQVTLEEFFAALEMSGRFGGVAFTFKFTPAENASSVYICNVRDMLVEPDQPPAENAFFDLQPLLVSNQLTIDDITTAIRTAWIADGGPEPKTESLRYHQETKLLIVTGPASRLESATTLIKLLTDRLRPSSDQQQRTIENLEAQLDRSSRGAAEDVARLRAMLDQREQEMARSREQIAKLEIELAKRDAQR